MDMYDIQYEQVPYFCFFCGRLGHSDPYCPTTSSRDDKGELPFGSKLRALEDYRKPASSENSREQSGASSIQATKNSSTKRDTGEEVNSLVKNKQQHKRKEAPTQIYKPVVKTTLLLTDGGTETGVDGKLQARTDTASTSHDEGEELAREPKKKKPTPDNSAGTASQSCQS